MSGTKAVYKQRADGFWQVYWEKDDHSLEMRLKALEEASRETGVNLDEHLSWAAIVDPKGAQEAIDYQVDTILTDGNRAGIISFQDGNEGIIHAPMESKRMFSMMSSPNNEWFMDDSGHQWRFSHLKDGRHVLEHNNAGVPEEVVEYDHHEWAALQEAFFLNNSDKGGFFNPFVERNTLDIYEEADHINEDGGPTNPQEPEPDREELEREEDYPQEPQDAPESNEENSEYRYPIPDFSAPVGSPEWPNTGRMLLESHAGTKGNPLPSFRPIPPEMRQSLGGMRYYFPGFKPANHMEAAMMDCLAHEAMTKYHAQKLIVDASEAMKNGDLTPGERNHLKSQVRRAKADLKNANVRAKSLRKKINKEASERRWREEHPVSSSLANKVKTGARATMSMKNSLQNAYRKESLRRNGIKLPMERVPDPSIHPADLEMMKLRGEKIPMVNRPMEKVSRKDYNKLMKDVRMRKAVNAKNSFLTSMRRGSDMFFMRTLKSPMLARVSRAFIPKPKPYRQRPPREKQQKHEYRTHNPRAYQSF